MVECCEKYLNKIKLERISSGSREIERDVAEKF